MKFLHTADTHIGYRAYRKINPKTGINIRTEDFASSFSKVIDAAIEERVDFVLHSGDLFHATRPNTEALQMAIKPIKKLLDSNIPIFIIAGNHDLPSQKGIGSPIRILANFDKCYAWTRASSKLLNIDNKDINIVGIPYIRDEPEEIFSAEIEKISAKTGDINILMSHQSLEEVKRGAEENFTRFAGNKTINKSQVPITFNYIALGHVHTHQIITHPMNKDIQFVYPGSTERTSISERNEEKGYYIVELVNDNLETNFHPLETREMLNLEYIITNKEIPTIRKEIRNLLDNTDIDGKIVSIRLKGKHSARELAQIDFISIFNDYKQALNIKEYKDSLLFEEIEGEIVTSDQKVFTPYEELQRYVERVNINKADKKVMLKIGKEIIEGREE